LKRKTARERYVFNDNGKKIGDFKRSFYTVCKNAGLKNMHIHDLRRVFASKIVIGGTSLYITYRGAVGTQDISSAYTS
jgi:hypothetical protein